MAWSRTAYRLPHQHLRGRAPPPEVAGDLDLTTAPALTRHLEQAVAQQPRRLVLDLTQVTFVDVAAARLLAGANRLPPPGPPRARPAGAPPGRSGAPPHSRPHRP